MVNKIEELLIPLASNLKISVGELWNILIKQVYVDGIISLLICIFVSVLTWWSYKVVKVKRSDPDYDEEKVTFSKIYLFLSLCLTALIYTIFIPNVVTSFVNPEFRAIQIILKAMSR